MNASLITHQPDYLKKTEQDLYEMARTNLGNVINTYSGPEAMAMLKFEQLRLSNGLDLAALLIKGKLIDDIEEHQLWSVMPGNYRSLEEAINDQANISQTQYSIITNLYKIVFPYITENVGMSIPEFWDKIGKSGASEAIPYLRKIITEKASRSDKVNHTVEDIYEELETLGIEDKEEKKKKAVEYVLDAAGNTVTEFRKMMKRTPGINFVTLIRNEKTYLVADVSEDQLSMLKRILGDHMDFTCLNLDTEDPLRIPIVKNLLGKENECQEKKLLLEP